MLPENPQLASGGDPTALASGLGLALVPSTIPRAHFPSNTSLCNAWLMRTKQEGTIRSQELWVWAGSFSGAGAQVPLCPKEPDDPISTAQPGWASASPAFWGWGW